MHAMAQSRAVVSPADLPVTATERLNISNSVAGFVRHDLIQQNQVALMNRVDDKYLISVDDAAELLMHLQNDYSILSNHDQYLFTYETQYLDDDNLSYYQQHHNGQLSRKKVRLRHYVNTKNYYLEVKTKNNKRRTIKQRCAINNLPAGQTLRALSDIQLENILADHTATAIPLDAGTALKPSLMVSYQRITLLNTTNKERLTLDLNVEFTSLLTGQHYELAQLVILELKRELKMQKSSFSAWIKQRHIRPINFSKYCMGSVLTHRERIKINRFKPVLRHLNNFCTHSIKQPQ